MHSTSKRDDTRQRLIEAGAEIIHRQGYNGTGIQQILESCAVPKGSFYHFFKSKEDFALALLDHYAMLFTDRVTVLFGEASLSPLERVRLFFDRTVERQRDPENPFGTCGCPVGNLVQELSPMGPALRQRLDSVLGRLEQGFADVLRQGQARGEIAARHDPDEAAQFIVATWQGAILRMKAAGGPQPLLRAREFLLDLLTR
ncbi:MAG: TetR family transcriptional regulator C-terminal domain-containing protein [Humidesulfovibrio sp.]|nr:TetR family transcriptional regulator C-terminal domain-containing protein [Humidesulfovibrio sp.]